MSAADIDGHIATIGAGKTSEERNPAAEAIADIVASGGVSVFKEADLETKLIGMMGNKKKPGPREGAMVCINAMCNKCFAPCEPYLIKLFPEVLQMCGDKMKFIGEAAARCCKTYMDSINPYAAAKIVPVLFSAMTDESKWQSHVAALNCLGYLCVAAGEQVALEMKIIVPKVAAMMWEMKQEVKDAAKACLTDVCECIDNADIQAFVPALISMIANPAEVEECIHLLAATTFVQTVTSAPLAIVVPLLTRGFSEKATATKRLCAVIIENMAKLVDEPSDAEPLMTACYDELKKTTETVSNPECRSVCERALAVLDTIKIKMVNEPRKILYFDPTLASLKETIGDADDFATPAIEYTAELVVSMANCRQFEEAKWTKAFTDILGPHVGNDKAATDAKATLATSESNTEPEVEIDLDEDVENLCECNFSLAYGSKILLNNTNMKLKRGFKYGLMGPNQCGKTTLLAAIANEQVEGFPPPSEVKTIFVQTDIHADDSDMSVIDYVMADTVPSGTRPAGQLPIEEPGFKEQAIKVLDSVGFVKDDKDYTGEGARQSQETGQLSGGWRMKLALSRAMLMNADIMLLDEPTNHLDVSNVAWVKEYLNNLKQVTCIMVSHDKGLLNDVCTHIIQMDSLKLRTYKGNLTEFVKVVPMAAHYLVVEKAKVAFNFPQPGKLEGINSKGKKVMTIDKVTFTYPKNLAIGLPPTLYDITVRCSLSSRVACVGKNGAGKSTMIKLLTGELEPCEGKIWKHPNCIVGYIAQHAFHHIEQHMSKTPNEYIQWRYASGDDKEALAKDTMILNAEELKLMATPFEYKWTDEESGKSMKEKRVIEKLSGGRRTMKNKSFEYEVKWVAKPAGMNGFVHYDELMRLGFEKPMKQMDEKIASRNAAYARPLTGSNVEKHFVGIGLEAEFASHTRIRALSGGQKVKVVLGACLWNQPHILILDEPTNYLDRDALGALMAAIEVFEGGVVMITHNNDFCSQLCPETWVLEAGHLNCKGDPEWMAQLANEKVEIKSVTEMTDAFGNTVKIKAAKKKLSRKEKKAKERLKKMREKRGDAVSDDEDDY
jgi:elongation factor 3